MVEKKQVKKFGQGPPTPFSGNARKKSIFLCQVVPYLIMMTDTYVIIGFDDYRGCVVQNISSLLVFWVVDVKATKN